MRLCSCPEKGVNLRTLLPQANNHLAPLAPHHSLGVQSSTVAMPGFAVDSHPQRAKIIDMLLQGRSCESISSSIHPRIGHTSIWRYRRYKSDNELRNAIQIMENTGMTSVMPTTTAQPGGIVANAPASAAELARVMLTSRISSNYHKIDTLIADESGANAAALLNADARQMELHAKITGVLQDQATINVLMIQAREQAPAAAERDQAEPIGTGEVIDLTPE